VARDLPLGSPLVRLLRPSPDTLSRGRMEGLVWKRTVIPDQYVLFDPKLLSPKESMRGSSCFYVEV
jgi:hypothetical protein